MAKMVVVRKSIILLLICLSVFLVNAQMYWPGNLPVFATNEVTRIDILISQTALDSIYNPDLAWSDFEHKAKLVINNSFIHDTIDQLGFRLRGNTSRVSQKKSFKLSFNTYVPGRKYYGMEKLNLNGEHNDPCIMRARLCWDIFHKSGCVSARSCHMAVYINHVYYGLYTGVEHIDEQFVKSRYGNKDGNLYKCLYPADLAYISSNPNDYKFSVDGRRVYDLKTNKEQDNYTDLAYFISVLNQTPIASLPEQLEPIFNVNGFLKILAVDVLTSNWDGYAYNKNNFYLYHNSLTNQFEYVPYDVDNTFGIDWFNIDWGTRNIYNWAASENRPLVKRILQVPEYKNRFSYYLNKLMISYFNSGNLYTEIDAMKALILPFVQADMYRTLDYGWNMNEFNQSFTQALGNHVKYGLKSYVSTRRASAQTQLNLTNISPIIEIYPMPLIYANQPMNFRALLDDESTAIEVILHYQINGGNWQEAPMLDNGLSNDGLAGDKIFGVTLEALGSQGYVNYYLTAVDWNQISSRSPLVSHKSVEISGVEIPQICINEFMAINTSFIADENGGFGDWVELYNTGNSDISLAGFYLTDNLETARKYALPDSIIPAGGFKIVWTDNDPEQGSFHTNFNLDGFGEEIGLFYSVGENNILVDQLKFNMQRSNVSTGRFKDGSGFFYPMYFPSPGMPNFYNSTEELKPERWEIFPNPAVDKIVVQADISLYNNSLQIYTLYGNKVLDALINEKENHVDISKLSDGLYLFVVYTGNNIVYRGKLLKESY